MEAYTFCQSCGRLMDRPESMGTEKDRSKSTIYCNNCYWNGEFTDPDITLEAMKLSVRRELTKANTPEPLIVQAVARIKNLSRWMGIPAIHHYSEWH